MNAHGDLRGERVELLVFVLEGQRYALPLPDVREVLRAVAITRLPAGPDFVEGVIDLRGTLVPVVDLRRRLAWPERPIQLHHHLIVARAGSQTVAIRVDGVEGLVALDGSAVESARDLAGHVESLAGVARLPDGLVLIHDLRRLLTPAEAAELADALRGHRAAEGRP